MAVTVVDRRGVPADLDDLARLAELTLAEEGLLGGFEVSITLVDEAEMARLNRRYMGGDGPTDVLAFPVEDLQPGRLPEPHPDGPPLLLGDVVIAPDYVERQAAELGVRFSDELRLMLVHGLLHLLGYDHVTRPEAEAMEERERRILAHVGVERR
ncbi:MAG: endoribonuclease YbeY [Acidimicrobiia bacterium]|nr:MAG: endoribonuclease YbeY [Acidimicrobiia bacterium]